jgi:hypothetical protein
VDEVTKITDKKIEHAYDAWSSAESQQAVYNTLAPGGRMVIVLNNQIKEVPGKDVTIVNTYAIVHEPKNRDIGVSLYSQLERLLREEKIKVSGSDARSLQSQNLKIGQPSAIEVLSNGLSGIPEGLARLEAGRISGGKLIALPLQTL